MESGSLADLELALRFVADHPEEAAAALERCEPAASADLLAEAPPELAASVLRRLAPEYAGRCVVAADADRQRSIGAELPPDVLASILRRLDDAERDHVLAALVDSNAAPVRSLLRFPADKAGSLMDPRVAALPGDIRVDEAVERLRSRPASAIYYVYVIDRDQKLVGVVNLRELLFAPGDAKLLEVMRRPVASARADASLRELRAHPGWRAYHALPVVDAQGAYVGAIRYEALRALESDSSSDAQRAGLLDVALSLAELAWLGLGGVLDGVSAGSRPPRRDVRGS